MSLKQLGISLFVSFTVSGCSLYTPHYETYSSQTEMYDALVLTVDQDDVDKHSNAMKILYLANQVDIEKEHDLDTIADDIQEQVSQDDKVSLATAAAYLAANGPFSILGALNTYNIMYSSSAKMPTRYTMNQLIVVEPFDDLSEIDNVYTSVQKRVENAVSSMMDQSVIPYTTAHGIPTYEGFAFTPAKLSYRLSRTDSDLCSNYSKSPRFATENVDVFSVQEQRCTITTSVNNSAYTKIYRGDIYIDGSSDAPFHLVTRVQLRETLPVSKLLNKELKNAYLFMPALTWMDIQDLTDKSKISVLTKLANDGDLSLQHKMYNLSSGSEMVFGLTEL